MNINGSTNTNIQGIYEVSGAEEQICLEEQKKEKTSEKKGGKGSTQGGKMQKNRGKSPTKGREKKNWRETEGGKDNEGRKKKEINPKNGRKEKKKQKEKPKSSLRRNGACKGFTDNGIKGLCRVGAKQGIINIARSALSEAVKNQKLLKTIKTSVLRIIKKLNKIGSGRSCGKKKEKKKKITKGRKSVSNNVDTNGIKSPNDRVYHLGDYKKNLLMSAMKEGQINPIETYDTTPLHQVIEPIFLEEMGDYDFSSPTSFLLNTPQNLGGDFE